jgi:small subunit ribosomal protein S6
MDSSAKNYEIAFLLMPSLTDEEALAHAGRISSLAEADGGTIRHMEMPKKCKLMYPIKKQQTAYFSWIVAGLAPGSVNALDKKINATPEVLRAMVVEHEVETRQPYIRPLSPRAPAGSTQPPKAVAIPREEQKTDERLDLEALDKRLEEILGT